MINLHIVNRIKSATINTLKSLFTIAPMLLAIIGLLGLFKTYITPQMIHSL